MNIVKQMLAILLSVLLVAVLSCGMIVSADETADGLQGARWFPIESGYENDMLWEVQFTNADYCRFDDDPDEVGGEHFLETTYTEYGALVLRRTGADGAGDVYWPNVRTLQLDNYPALDLTVANTLYFDVEAVDCSWNLVLSVNGMNVKFSKVIADACGVAGVANSDADAPAGTYKGTVNLQDAWAAVAAESGTECCTNALAMQNMGADTFVPQVTIYYVGTTAGSLTINELFISTPEDTTGAHCEFMSFDLMFEDTDGDFNIDPDDTAPPIDNTTMSTKESTNAPNATETSPFPWWIVLAAGGVLFAAAVALIVVKKKKA